MGPTYALQQTPIDRDASDSEIVADGLRRQMMHRMRSTCKDGTQLRARVVPLPQGAVEDSVVEHDTLDTDIDALVSGELGQTCEVADQHRDTPRVLGLLDRSTSQDRREQYAIAQEKCDWCARIRKYLLQGKHADTDSHAQQKETERDARECCMYDGLLYRHSDQRDGPGLQLCTVAHLVRFGTC